MKVSLGRAMTGGFRAAASSAEAVLLSFLALAVSGFGSAVFAGVLARAFSGGALEGEVLVPLLPVLVLCWLLSHAAFAVALGLSLAQADARLKGQGALGVGEALGRAVRPALVYAVVAGLLSLAAVLYRATLQLSALGAYVVELSRGQAGLLEAAALALALVLASLVTLFVSVVGLLALVKAVSEGRPYLHAFRDAAVTELRWLPALAVLSLVLGLVGGLVEIAVGLPLTGLQAALPASPTLSVLVGAATGLPGAALGAFVAIWKGCAFLSVSLQSRGELYVPQPPPPPAPVIVDALPDAAPPLPPSV